MTAGVISRNDRNGRGAPHRNGGERETCGCVAAAVAVGPCEWGAHPGPCGGIERQKAREWRPPRPAAIGGASRPDGGNGHESIQGIAFMARESRPARPPEPRKEQRKEHRKGQFRSNSQGRPRDARQPQR